MSKSIINCGEETPAHVLVAVTAAPDYFVSNCGTFSTWCSLLPNPNCVSVGAAGPAYRHRGLLTHKARSPGQAPRPATRACRALTYMPAMIMTSELRYCTAHTSRDEWRHATGAPAPETAGGRRSGGTQGTAGLVESSRGALTASVRTRTSRRWLPHRCHTPCQRAPRGHFTTEPSSVWQCHCQGSPQHYTPPATRSPSSTVPPDPGPHGYGPGKGAGEGARPTCSRTPPVCPGGTSSAPCTVRHSAHLWLGVLLGQDNTASPPLVETQHQPSPRKRQGGDAHHQVPPPSLPARTAHGYCRQGLIYIYIYTLQGGCTPDSGSINQVNGCMGGWVGRTPGACTSHCWTDSMMWLWRQGGGGRPATVCRASGRTLLPGCKCKHMPAGPGGEVGGRFHQPTCRLHQPARSEPSVEQERPWPKPRHVFRLD